MTREFQIQKIIKIVTDPALGDIMYDEYNSPDLCKFDKDAHVCDMPFYDVEIKHNGDVYLCCPAWNPVIIGNLLENDMRTIWNGVRANAVRTSVTDGSYKYCNHKTCPAMIAGGGDRIIQKEAFVDPQRSLPRNFAFSIDNTCNLTCPTCRTSKILSLDNETREKSLAILRSVFRSVFNEPHNDEVIMTFDGAGEIFFSGVYREIFETEEVFLTPDKWPNFKVVLCTNGTMMTEKIQDKYRNMFNRSLGIRISIDAGNKDSYEKVRQGGDWELLWNNINYLYNNTLKSNSSISWAWNLILQDDNFESLPELVKLAHQYPENLPEIYITNVLNWGTWSIEEYNKKAVWLPTAPRHSLLKEILSLPEVNNYPKIFKPTL